MRRHRLVLLTLLLNACAEASDRAAGPEDAALPPPDAAPAPPDAAFVPDAAPRGEFGEPCSDNADCASGYCVEAADLGRICTRACGQCPEGFECTPIANGGPDRLFLCLTDQPELCKPCTTDRECDDTEDRCLDFGRNRYCGEDCSDDGVCPAGYECVDIRDGDAGIARQCVPAGGESCGPCRDADGDGYGEGADCLGFDCDDDDPDVYAGAPERCNDKDDDCNALVDDAPVGAPAEVQCFDQGVCAGVRLACLEGEWRCAYPVTWESDVETRCDGLDNDCDGQTDEGLLGTPEHCAHCGHVCAFPHAAAHCVEGGCEPGDCEPGWHDVDGNAGNGCEYACLPTRDGVEACDGIDNDCDGQTDEDFDLRADPAHCGACGHACAPPNARPACADGACAIERCLEGFHDLDGDPDNGCEYGCAPAGDERCNGADDDCDGQADEGFDLLSDAEHCGACGRACAPPNAVGRCAAGTCGIAECLPGFFDVDGDPENGCEYACHLAAGGVEACNGIDDDCDARVDEDFDLGSDEAHCGACGRRCELLNAAAECRDGGCVQIGCDDGFHDLDGRPGCEYACRPGNGGVEICNRADDDCDGEVDEGTLNRCGACGPEPSEVCNGADDDCDGEIDEGTLNRCGACGPEPPEVCNGADDDCNGVVDDHGVCGPYVQSRCRLFFGWADRRAGPATPSARWGGCPGIDRDTGGDVRCTGTRRDGRFAKVDLGGDVNDDDEFALMFVCDDPADPALARYVQTHCAVFTGHADRQRGPDGVDAWGPCPRSLSGDDGRLRCTSSGFDGRFRHMTLTGDVDDNDDFGVAWICRDPDDPARALALQRSVEVILGWADENHGRDGVARWATCPPDDFGIANRHACVSTRGDGRFHRLNIDPIGGDVDDNDDVAWALRARPDP